MRVEVSQRWQGGRVGRQVSGEPLAHRKLIILPGAEGGTRSPLPVVCPLTLICIPSLLSCSSGVILPFVPVSHAGWLLQVLRGGSGDMPPNALRWSGTLSPARARDNRYPAATCVLQIKSVSSITPASFLCPKLVTCHRLPPTAPVTWIPARIHPPSCRRFLLPAGLISPTPVGCQRRIPRCSLYCCKSWISGIAADFFVLRFRKRHYNLSYACLNE